MQAAAAGRRVGLTGWVGEEEEVQGGSTRGSSGEEREDRLRIEGAGRTWDLPTALLNEEALTQEELEATPEGMVDSARKIISTLNTTLIANGKKEVQVAKRMNKAIEPLTRRQRKEQRDLMATLQTKIEEIETAPLISEIDHRTHARKVAALGVFLALPSTLGHAGLGGPDWEMEEYWRKQREAKLRERADPLDPFSPTRKWFNASEARGLMPDRADEFRKLGEWMPEIIQEAKDNPQDWGGEEGDDEGPGGAGEKWQETPWYCEVCDVSATNDMMWLDHVNGIKHNKMLGYSMRHKEESPLEVQCDAIIHVSAVHDSC
ncbi:hypothetical protein T484DRAFT_1842862 [Baffinella frigidus]|nr:hypothetical protein T484DRAFT_1842862 [Cryptophyta sp. CCMP2293]